MSLRGALIRNQVPVPIVGRQASRYSWFARRRVTDEGMMSTYETVGTIFGVVHSLAVATAKADWHLYRSAKSGLKEDRVEVTNHACVDLWHMPNKFMPRRRFIETAQQHIDLTGESDILPSSFSLAGKSVPIELWPMRPDRIVPVPDPFEFIKGYVYTAPDGEEVPLDVSECLPILMPNPRNPYRGLGPVQSIMATAQAAKAHEDWDLSFFENSAEPGGIIEVPTALSDPDFDQLRDRWAATHQGVSKAHRVAILEGGMKWIDRSFTQRDMQFVEAREVKRDTILEAFGFPKPMLGITSDVNRANAEAAEYVFAKWLISERLDRWRDWLNFQLLPLYGSTGQGLEWDYDSPVSENSETENAATTAKSNAAVAMAGAGFDSVETLEWLDMPEISFEKPAPPPIMTPGSSQGPNVDPTQDPGAVADEVDPAA